MMKLMFNLNDGGFHNFQEDELDEAKKAGWVDGEPIRKAMLDAKRKDDAKSVTVTIAKVPEPDTLPAQSEVQAVKRAPGRPRKEVPSVLNDGEV